MTINEFAVLVAKKEKGRKEVNIAQIKEVLKVVREQLYKADVDLYQWIKAI